MGMNVGKPSGDPDVLVDMNTTPLIDVMLVLLIMFIITIPVQLHSVEMNMPPPTNVKPPVEPEIMKIDIDENSVVYMNGVAIQSGQQELEYKLAELAKKEVQPEIHLRPNKNAKYEVVARVMATVQRLGLTKMGILGHEQFI
ncbi:MAG: biopolymer transporter ExbD [Burkholderiales bacterium]|nr:MAG: biopolymer transporter ExbD [Betaproteobacteria bacterium]TAG78107.1 MAG: biopolymer transporter ExbD [Burkholderiales bacterium]